MQPAKFSNKPIGKTDRILFFLRDNECGLNLVEAAAMGDFTLRSTIAVLRNEGWLIEGTWERVAIRAGALSRVIRYRLTGYRNPAETAEDIAALLG